ncbi:SIR2 family histone deacetylase-like protein [Niveomyces insectorum RCEF 264]|uniref:SIR2 family histone deacetylase-like protein n=1 Tax=Niveomyces insectorum RCEF 264 TaxID=1081102 RepID=A0A167Y1W2_9HYPO|nr:SIR2 family histone deacetylase-like protein [Niveomyces insectorum RCEF 264]
MAARKPLMRIPYTDVFAAPRIIPRQAVHPQTAVAALRAFLTAPPPPGLPASTVILTGAGLSVASGLADYRGENGTYRVNKTYRPIYFHEFLASHEARKRYWARSFLGWTTLHKATPNASHYALRDLGRLGYVHAVVTQNVDSFHRIAHPDVPTTVELHGYLRSTVCTTCHHEYPRDTFQTELARLNPAWAAFLADAVAAGALAADEPTTGAPSAHGVRGIRTNPDGDVDLPDAPYTTFRYPPCPNCLAHPPVAADGTQSVVEVDADGAWSLPEAMGSRGSNDNSNNNGGTDGVSKKRYAGILKPAVVMFGESIAPAVKQAAEVAIDGAGRLLILATSLATYSAWRLAKRAKDRGMPIGIVNIGGVRGEEIFFTDLDPQQKGNQAVRLEMPTDRVLPMVVEELKKSAPRGQVRNPADAMMADPANPAIFRDMLS